MNKHRIDALVLVLALIALPAGCNGGAAQPTATFTATLLPTSTPIPPTFTPGPPTSISSGASVTPATPIASARIGGKVQVHYIMQDKKQYMPLQRVTVYLIGDALSRPLLGTTDSEGEYEFNYLLPGEYTLILAVTPEHAAFRICGILNWSATWKVVSKTLSEGRVIRGFETPIVLARGIRTMRDWTLSLLGVQVARRADFARRRKPHEHHAPACDAAGQTAHHRDLVTDMGRRGLHPPRH